MSALDLLRPAWWPCLLAAPLLFVYLLGRSRIRARRLQEAVGARLPVLAAEASPRRRRVRPLLFSLGVLLALVAMLEPRHGHAKAQGSWQGVDLVLCLDVSRSMRATDLAPDRLGRAKQGIGALAARASGDRLALVAFAGEARLISPMTHDRRSLMQLVEESDPTSVPRGGTDLGAALEAALAALSGNERRPAAIVLLTDGEDHRGRGLRLAKRCRARGVPVHCLGLGTSLGSKIPMEADGGTGFVRDRSGREVISSLKPDTLRALTHAADGAYVAAASAGAPLVALYEDEILPTARLVAGKARNAEKESRYQWPLLLALLLLLADRALGDRRRS